jgi:hypothetical protein
VDSSLDDAAKRLSDAVTLHMLATNNSAAGSWIAARLSDGGTNGDVYETREQAIRHNPDYHCYLLIPPDGMGIQAASIFLRFNRVLFKNGMRMPEPDREFVMPQNVEDIPGGRS